MVRPPYRIVRRLWAIAEERWPEVEGYYQGVDLLELRHHQFLNYIWYWSIQHVDPKAMEEWKMAMNAPLLPSELRAGDTGEVWSDEDEAAAWQNAMSSLGGM